jgi:competence protein ComEC
LVRDAFAKWAEAERGRFSLLLPVAMGAAILAYFALPTEPPLWLGATFLGLSLIGLAAGWRHPYCRFAAALALAASLGFARAEWRTAAQPPLITIPTGPLGLSGTIAQIDLLPGARRLTLSHPSLYGAAPLARAIRLRLRAADTTPLTVGESVRAYAMLFPPDRPAYPGGWDQGRQDFFAGLAASGFALGNVSITAPAPPDAPAAWLQNLRARIAVNILKVLPVSTGSIAVTLLTGDQQAIPPAERNHFIAAGLAHILAVAGLHVGIVMGLFFTATRFLLTRHESLALRLPVKPIAAAVALLAGAAYAALTGAHLPIIRSLAMASLVTFGVIMGRRAISLRGLALAAAAIMLVTPEAVLGVSFQMSFSAVLALIAGFAAVQHAMTRFHASSSRAGSLALHGAALAYTSLLAGGASMPFAAYQFQQVQPYWIPANLLAVPLTALWILPFGLLALALMPLGLQALALLPMARGIAIILWITARIATWPAAMLRIPPMPSLAILLIAAGLTWLCIWRSAPRFAGLALMLAGLAVYAAARPPDILVSPDARLIAIRAAPHIFLLSRGKPPSYTLAQWAPVWGGTPLTPARCTQNTCRLGAVLFALTPPPGGCGHALVAVSPELLRGACGSIPVIDRLSVYRNGATAAWITGHRLTLLTDRAVQGTRPWVALYPG